MKKFLLALSMFGFLTGTAFAQTVTIGLAWDHDGVGLGISGGGFVMERKLGTNGTYAQVGSLIAPGDRTFVDTFTAGQLFCWQVRARNAFFTSAPSNEVCLIEATRPFNLRIQ